MFHQIRISKLEDAERQSIYGNSRISLCQEAEGIPGLTYLTQKRGIDVESIAKFKLGYVPFQRNHIFSGRIVIPIFDAYSRLLALSVRPIYDIIALSGSQKLLTAIEPRFQNNNYVYENEKGEMASVPSSSVSEIISPKPKYWNEAYPKGEHLFGLQLAKYHIAKAGFAIVVEGQMDVIAMHSFGIRNTVGLLGGGFTPIHAMLLKRWCSQIVLLMDSDPAGREHVIRANEILGIYRAPIVAKNKNLPNKVLMSCDVKLPKDSDPDAFLQRNGSVILKKLIVESMLHNGLSSPKGWEK